MARNALESDPLPLWACSSAGRAPALQDAGPITQVPHLVSLTRKTHGAPNLLNWTEARPKVCRAFLGRRFGVGLVSHGRTKVCGVIGRLRSSSIGWFMTANRRGSLHDEGLLRYKGIPA